MANPSSNEGEKLLYFEERNVTGSHTIIFLHGGASSHLEWERIASDAVLAPYHLLLVDLPAHSGSRSIGPFSLPKAADEVAKVIRRHGHDGGRSHVVGFSLGAFAALVLTARHPDVLLSTFTTGAYEYRGIFRWFAGKPDLLWNVEQVSNFLGLTALAQKSQGLKIDPKLAEDIKNNRSRELTRNMFTSALNDFGTSVIEQVAESGVRVCVIAGGKMDQVDRVKSMGLAIRDGGGKKGLVNRVIIIRDGYHPWHFQFPGLFIAGVKAWVEGEELPHGYEDL
ncbi:Alpha/Beta hydrolase protein [Xylariales sp. PMI_506]|nr:Alpha/Beta hydrolase protein [Xylariales sp. PMI_506]